MFKLAWLCRGCSHVQLVDFSLGCDDPRVGVAASARMICRRCGATIIYSRIARLKLPCWHAPGCKEYVPIYPHWIEEVGQ